MTGEPTIGYTVTFPTLSLEELNELSALVARSAQSRIYFSMTVDVVEFERP